MPYQVKHGDLLDLTEQGHFDVIVHGCNCQNRMGKGIALSIKTRFPEAYVADHRTTKSDRNKLGSFSQAKICRDPHSFVIVNAYTQFDWRGSGVKADYAAIRQVFRAIAQQFTGRRIGFPKIGAGLAGGDWTIIEAIIHKELKGEDYTLVEFREKKPRKTARKIQAFVIGEYVDKPRATSYGVGYLLEECEDRIEFWGGNSWDFSGGGIALDKVVDDPYWLEHFRNAKAEWFYDFVLRMAKGEFISNVQIEAEYFLRHGEAIKLTGCTRYSYFLPMSLHLHHGNLLDLHVDVLVCSANVSLNLTGGVGGELLLRYGGEMQKELHALLKSRERHFAQPGEVFLWRSPNCPYLGVLHAVAIDGFYQSSVEMITKTCRVALQKAAALGAKRVALAALATGFGNLDLDDFASGLSPLLSEDFSPVEDLYLAQIEEYRYQELIEAFSTKSTAGGTPAIPRQSCTLQPRSPPHESLDLHRRPACPGGNPRAASR